jgi:hypothetical protein
MDACMNLNEECLLQFLKNDGAIAPSDDAPFDSSEGGLVSDLRRIIRRDRFVSFPSGIVIRRKN